MTASSGNARGIVENNKNVSTPVYSKVLGQSNHPMIMCIHFKAKIKVPDNHSVKLLSNTRFLLV